MPKPIPHPNGPEESVGHPNTSLRQHVVIQGSVSKMGSNSSSPILVQNSQSTVGIHNKVGEATSLPNLTLPPTVHVRNRLLSVNHNLKPPDPPRSTKGSVEDYAQLVPGNQACTMPVEKPESQEAISDVRLMSGIIKLLETFRNGKGKLLGG
ncbi:uncharacterized protein LOC129311884 isoform X2 [Prosopis cineraria]|uniref:uncharacterized protein LOC129311884 isoform X2 n=1 Tax=Prosopis cineraria TaxID=364024 RepID=UPI00240F4990|nr:uncharacterized protein LOC129311884 isoform X2 [Prosopis cineraria]